MPKYVYPAIFTREDNDQYSVDFPDVKNCFTGGDTLIDAIEMAKDVLAMMLADLEDKALAVPEPTPIEKIETDNRSFINLISCDTTAYRKMTDSRAVKKTLTIPSWLNHQAELAGVSFSQVLQDALIEKLNIQ